MADTTYDSQTATLTDLYNYQLSTGTIEAVDTSTVETLVENDVSLALNGVVKADESTPMGRMLEWLTLNFANVLHVNVQNANQLIISAAAGQQLDAIGQWFRLTRKGETHTTVTCQLTGTDGTIVPKGSRVRTQDGNYFELTTDTAAFSSGQGTGYFQSVEAGAIPCPASTLNIIDTPVGGWDTCTNASAGVLGGERESDDDFKERIMETKFTGLGFLGSVKNALDEIDGVTSSMALENYTGAELDVNGVPMAPHTIFVCVDGIVDANKDAIAKAVFQTKSSGTGYTRFYDKTNEVAVTVTDEYGNEYPVYIYKPEACAIRVDIIVTKRGYTGTDLEGDVRTAITDWASSASLGIGKPVYASDIIKAVEASVGGVIVASATMSDGGVFTDCTYVDVPGHQKASFTASNITVKEFTR